jgi:hypothetical protein
MPAADAAAVRDVDRLAHRVSVTSGSSSSRNPVAAAYDGDAIPPPSFVDTYAWNPQAARFRLALYQGLNSMDSPGVMLNAVKEEVVTQADVMRVNDSFVRRMGGSAPLKICGSCGQQFISMSRLAALRRSD